MTPTTSPDTQTPDALDASKVLAQLRGQRASLREQLAHASATGDLQAILDLQAKGAALDAHLPHAELAALKHQASLLGSQITAADKAVTGAAQAREAAQEVVRTAQAAANAAQQKLGVAGGTYAAAEHRLSSLRGEVARVNEAIERVTLQLERV